MEFFIKKNATLPLLKMQVVKDGRSDYNDMMDFIEESAVFFSMVNVDNGIPKITTRPAGFVEKIQLDPNASPEYYVYYQFTPKDTNKVGKFEGQFLFRNDQGTLVLPIRDKLFIYVQESFIADDLPYESCYVIDFPCCVAPPPIPPPVTTTTTTLAPPPPTVDLTLLVDINPGSIDVDYMLFASEPLFEDYTLSFDTTLFTYTGNPISYFTGITISAGEISGTTNVLLNENFDNLNREFEFSNFSVSTTGITFNFQITTEIIIPTPTPTPTTTPTVTPTQTVTPTSTTTPTPTLTPTPTNSGTPTPTPTPTNTQTPTQTPTHTPTPTPTVTPTSATEITINVDANVKPGSAICDFTLTSDYSVGFNYELPVMVIANLITGGTISFDGTINVNAGDLTGFTQIINESVNYNDLTLDGELFVGMVEPSIGQYVVLGNLTFDPYPTNLIDPIITQNGEYINLGDDEYLMY